MSRDHREIDGATLRDLADRAGAGALGDAGDEHGSGGIAQRLEERGIERAIDRAGAGGGVPGGCRRAWFAYLRHYASIRRRHRGVKDRRSLVA